MCDAATPRAQGKGVCRGPGSSWGPSNLRSDALPTELSRLWQEWRTALSVAHTLRASGARADRRAMHFSLTQCSAFYYSPPFPKAGRPLRGERRTRHFPATTAPLEGGGRTVQQMGKVARAVAARWTALTSPCPPRRPASGAWLRRLHCAQPGSIRSAAVSAPPLAPLRAPGLSRTRAGRGLLGIGASWRSACDCPTPPGMLGQGQRQWTAAHRRSEAQGDFVQTSHPPPAPSRADRVI